MGIGARVISAVLKSVVGDKVGTGLIKELADISIGEVSEKSISKINDFIYREKNKIENILSKENMKSMNIPEENANYVVAEVKDLLSGINIADEVLRQCKYDCKKLNDFLWTEYCKDKGGYIECKNDIKRTLLAVAEALIKLMYESENFQNKFLVQISNSVDNIDLDIHNISNYMKKNFNKLDVDNQNILNILLTILEQTKNYNAPDRDIEAKIQSRTQEYADKWNENMFLNDFDEWDENAGVNVKLSDVYLEEHLPHFVWGNNIIASTNLHTFLSRYIVEKNGNEMLLILGQPGIGKSTLITWITANFADQIDNILVYKFASDLKNVNWWTNIIFQEILGKLGLVYDELNGKTLILDGFDEITVQKSRKDILDLIYCEFIIAKSLRNFTLIITCRENYIDGFESVRCKYITLQPWENAQIISFCRTFQEKTKNNISGNTIEKLLENKEILGIPLILYMVLALNISIEKEGSIVDVYDKIFSLKGGIYDRCIDNKNFADKHRIGKIKKQVHQISRNISIWIFENNADEAYILQEEYQKICVDIMQEEELENECIQEDFLIANYFKLVRHCEGVETKELYFVHRSIYEYFVAETIYNSIENAIIELTEESQEVLAGKIVIYLKQGMITNTIGEYLRFKVLKLYNGLDIKKREYFYHWWEKTIEKLMNYGMFYFTGDNIKEYKSIVDKEIQCFYNLIKILKLLQKVCKSKYILEDADKKQLEKFIGFWFIKSRREMQYEVDIFDLSKFSLEGINFSGADLKKVNLYMANLYKANLSKTDMRQQDLRETNLVDADLYGADLYGANLVGANLAGANLDDVNLDASRWNMKDVLKVLPQLKFTRFIFIIVEDKEQKKLYKSELFPNE